MEMEHTSNMIRPFPRVFGSEIDQPNSSVIDENIPTKAVGRGKELKLFTGGKGDQLPLPTKSRRGLLGHQKENLVPGAGRPMKQENKSQIVEKIDSSDYDERCLAAVRSMKRNKEKLKEKARRKMEKERWKAAKEKQKLEKELWKTEKERLNLKIDKLHQDGLPNWAKTPTPALSIIFQKLGAAEFCASAQAVCRSWRRLPLTSPLPPCIDMRKLSTTRYPLDPAELAKRAVDCTRGPIEQLHVQEVSETFLTQIADRTHSLRCCSLIDCTSISTKVLIDFLRRCPLLEELNIYGGAFRQEIYLHIGEACPNLKRLSINASYNNATNIADSDSDYSSHKKFIKWDGVFESDTSDPDSDEDPDPIYYSEGFPSLGDWRALKIANNMRLLRELSIRRDLTLTNQGVHTIIDNCLDLECLELRCCYNIRVDPLLHAKLQKVKNVKLSRRSVLVLNKRLGKQFYV